MILWFDQPEGLLIEKHADPWPPALRHHCKHQHVGNLSIRVNVKSADPLLLLCVMRWLLLFLFNLSRVTGLMRSVLAKSHFTLKDRQAAQLLRESWILSRLMDVHDYHSNKYTVQLCLKGRRQHMHLWLGLLILFHWRLKVVDSVTNSLVLFFMDKVVVVLILTRRHWALIRSFLYLLIIEARDPNYPPLARQLNHLLLVCFHVRSLHWPPNVSSRLLLPSALLLLVMFVFALVRGLLWLVRQLVLLLLALSPEAHVGSEAEA